MIIYEFIAGAPWINLVLALWGMAIVGVTLCYASRMHRENMCACFDKIDLLIFVAGATQESAFRLGAWVGVPHPVGIATSRLALAALWLALTIIIVRHARRVK
jgi:hypothetical protein